MSIGIWEGLKLSFPSEHASYLNLSKQAPVLVAADPCVSMIVRPESNVPVPTYSLQYKISESDKHPNIERMAHRIFFKSKLPIGRA